MYKKYIFTITKHSVKLEVKLNTYLLAKIKPEISKTLQTNGKYEIGSNVKVPTLNEFFKYWINGELPNLNNENITEFQSLSNEFELMNDIIQLYNNVEKANSLIKSQNKKLKEILQSNKENNNNINIKYHEIIDILFNKIQIDDYSRFLEIKTSLYSYCNAYNVKRVYQLTRKTVTKNGLIFYLFDDSKTASVALYNSIKSEIVIPKSVQYKNNDYIVISIAEEAFKDSNGVTSIICANDSEIQTIENYAFSNSSVTNISIPSTIYIFKKKWCRKSKLNNITIFPSKNINIKFYDNNFIVGKSDLESDNFDVLIYAKNDTEEVVVPSNIT